MNDFLSIEKLPHVTPGFILSDKDASNPRIVAAFEAIKQAHKKGDDIVVIPNTKPFSCELCLWFGQHGYMTIGEAVRIDKSFDEYIENFPDL